MHVRGWHRNDLDNARARTIEILVRLRFGAFRKHTTLVPSGPCVRSRHQRSRTAQHHHHATTQPARAHAIMREQRRPSPPECSTAATTSTTCPVACGRKAQVCINPCKTRPREPAQSWTTLQPPPARMAFPLSPFSHSPVGRTVHEIVHGLGRTSGQRAVVRGWIPWMRRPSSSDRAQPISAHPLHVLAALQGHVIRTLRLVPVVNATLAPLAADNHFHCLSLPVADGDRCDRRSHGQ